MSRRSANFMQNALFLLVASIYHWWCLWCRAGTGWPGWVGLGVVYSHYADCAGPTLAPYVPVAGPEWVKCELSARCQGANERCVTSTASDDEEARHNNTTATSSTSITNTVTSSSSSSSGSSRNSSGSSSSVTRSSSSSSSSCWIGQCRCVGGFSRRAPHEPCRRERRMLFHQVYS